MNQPTRSFRPAEMFGAGLVCNDTGLVLGETPLLEKSDETAGRWRPRALADLSARYGLPVDLTAKLGGLNAIARALDNGDAALAQIAALHLRLPDLPELAKTSLGDDELIDLVQRLSEAGVLGKLEWDETKHPRWAAGSPDHQGGRFAPAGGAGAASNQGSGELTPVGYAKPLPGLPMAPGDQQLANALNKLRAGDGHQTVEINGTTLAISRSGALVTLTVNGLYTLRGIYVDTPGANGVDLGNVGISSSNPAFAATVIPDKPGGSTTLNAEIRVVSTVVGHTKNGTPVNQSALNVAYNHDVALSFQGLTVFTYKKNRFYDFH